ncbi:MAG: VanZ family protein [Candidatus Cloacimonetes bacterium]|nr:VanZ family protein [Candidatus Cloacimonadota bacterium]
MMNKNYYKVTFYIWLLVILTLTSLPKLHTPLDDSLNVDKLGHLFVYLIFAYLFMKMHREDQYRAKLKLLIIFAVVLPFVDELHQIPIPGRTFSFYDILADFLGFSIVITIYSIKLKNGCYKINP